MDLTFDHADIDSWPRSAKALCLVATAIVVLGIGYATSISGKRTELALVEARQSELLGERLDKHDLATGAAAERDAYDDARQSFAEMLGRLPRVTEIPGSSTTSAVPATSNGLAIDRVELADERDTDRYVELPIVVTASGDYHGIGGFVGAIARLPRLVTLHDFDLRRRGGTRDLELTIEARTYRYLPDPTDMAIALPAPLPESKQATVDSPAYTARAERSPFDAFVDADATPAFGQPDLARARGPLESVPLGQLEMVGTIRGRGSVWALIRGPDGSTQPLAIGGYLGRDHGRIASVGETGIEIVELVADGHGGWAQRPARLDLREDDQSTETTTHEHQQPYPESSDRRLRRRRAPVARVVAACAVFVTGQPSASDAQPTPEVADRYAGEAMSLHLQTSRCAAPLQLIADFAGVNLVAGDGVEGRITLQLADVALGRSAGSRAGGQRPRQAPRGVGHTGCPPGGDREPGTARTRAAQGSPGARPARHRVRPRTLRRGRTTRRPPGGRGRMVSERGRSWWTRAPTRSCSPTRGTTSPRSGR